MTQQVDINSLDEFLGNKAQNNPVVATPNGEPQQQTQNPMHSLNSGLSDGNNALTQINNLISNVNSLWNNISDTFIKKIEQKEQRINEEQGGRDYLGMVQRTEEQRQIALQKGIQPKDYPKKIDDTIPPQEPKQLKENITNEQISEFVNEWIISTLSTLDEEMTIKQLLDEWKGGRERMTELLTKMLLKIDEVTKNDSQ